MVEEKNYIYIMTNPAMPGLVKIGQSNNPERRRVELSSHSGVPVEFEIYATSEIPKKLGNDDTKIHHIILELNPDLKYNAKKEFFKMDPEAAFKLLYNIASIYGKEDLVVKQESNNESDNSVSKLPPFRFSMCNINRGETVTYINDKSIKVEVCGDRHVKYNDKTWSLSALASELLFGENRPIQGPLYFEYNGKTLDELRKENGKQRV